MHQTSEQLLEYPCEFTIKVIGRHDSNMEAIAIEVINRHVFDLSEAAVTTRQSKENNYTSVNVRINARCKEQLDAIYQDLTNHEKVLMAM